MKTICPACSSGHSSGSGSLTLTIRSARFQIGGGRGYDLGPVGGVLLVADAAPLPCPGLDQDLMARARQLLDADGDHGHAVFVRFDFLGHADDHDTSSVRGRVYSEKTRQANQGQTGAVVQFALVVANLPSLQQAGTKGFLSPWLGSPWRSWNFPRFVFSLPKWI